MEQIAAICIVYDPIVWKQMRMCEREARLLIESSVVAPSQTPLPGRLRVPDSPLAPITRQNRPFCRLMFLSYLSGGAIDARHVVDGHREKTLALLWQIIFHFQVRYSLYRVTIPEDNIGGI